MSDPHPAEAADHDGFDEDVDPDADHEVDAARSGTGGGPESPSSVFGRRPEDYESPRPDARPARRADCLPGGPNAARPCPFVSCEQHAVHAVTSRAEWGYLDEEEILARAFDPARPSCAADALDDAVGGATLDVVGDLFGVTRERARQMEGRAIRRLPPRLTRLGITAADARAILGAFEDVSTDAPRGRSRTQVRALGAERRERPAYTAHLPGPREVELAGMFWCDVIGAAVTTLLCNARHTARNAGPQLIPTYRVCASCEDGAALLARAEASTATPAVPPARRHLPLIPPPGRRVTARAPGELARELARFDPIARAAREGAQETTMDTTETTKPTTTTTPSAHDDGATPVAPRAPKGPLPKTVDEIEIPDLTGLHGDPPESTRVGGFFHQTGACAWCDEPRAPHRAGLPAVLKLLCAEHRKKVQTRLNRVVCTPEEAFRDERFSRLTGTAPPRRPLRERAPAPEEEQDATPAKAEPRLGRRSKAPRSAPKQPSARAKKPQALPASKKGPEATTTKAAKTSKAARPSLETDPIGFLGRLSGAVKAFGGIEQLEAVVERFPSDAGKTVLRMLDLLSTAAGAR